MTQLRRRISGLRTPGSRESSRARQVSPTRRWTCVRPTVAYVTDSHKWVIHGERLVDDTPHICASLADVEPRRASAGAPARRSPAPTTTSSCPALLTADELDPCTPLRMREPATVIETAWVVAV
jgi:hypothetical protein